MIRKHPRTSDSMPLSPPLGRGVRRGVGERAQEKSWGDGHPTEFLLHTDQNSSVHSINKRSLLCFNYALIRLKKEKKKRVITEWQKNQTYFVLFKL